LTVKVDLHIHTLYSPDSMITPQQLLYYARKRRLDGVAVTDHDRIDGALKIARETDFLVIPGMEVSSLNGHVVALNVHEFIPKGLGADETAERIHDAGGIAVASHPGTFLKISLGKYTSSKFDAVETINASAIPFRYSTKKSQKIASNLGLARVGGSDAHYGPEIGSAYTLVDSELDAERIVEAIRKGFCEAAGGAIPIFTRLKRETLIFGRKLR
jgi:predicted metal-dependent phosphoesterase TrpH